jgi:hypothetical protein
MSWDDSGSAFLHGTGPTLAVLDPDGTPNNILDEPIGGTCIVSWSFSGGGRIFLDPTVFTVHLYAGAIGPGPDKLVGTAAVPGTSHTVSGLNWDFSAKIPITPGMLPPNGPGVSGVYRLTAVITNAVGGVRDVLAGFVDGPVIEMRSP